MKWVVVVLGALICGLVNAAFIHDTGLGTVAVYALGFLVGSLCEVVSER